MSNHLQMKNRVSPRISLRNARLRHSSYYVQVAVNAGASFFSRHQAEGLMIFDQDRSQINAAWQWLLNTPSQADTNELMAHLYLETGNVRLLRYSPRERISQGEALINVVLNLSDRSDRLAECGFLYTLGTDYNNGGYYRKAAEYYEKALSVARIIENHELENAIILSLGNNYLNLREPSRALELHKQGLALAKEQGNLENEYTALHHIGRVYSYLGYFKRSLKYYEQSLLMARTRGDNLFEGDILCSMAFAYRWMGDEDRALDYFQQSILIFRQLGAESRVFSANAHLAKMLHHQSIYKGINQPDTSENMVKNYINYLERNKHSEESHWRGDLWWMRFKSRFRSTGRKSKPSLFVYFSNLAIGCTILIFFVWPYFMERHSFLVQVSLILIWMIILGLLLLFSKSKGVPPRRIIYIVLPVAYVATIIALLPILIFSVASVARRLWLMLFAKEPQNHFPELLQNLEDDE